MLDTLKIPRLKTKIYTPENSTLFFLVTPAGILDIPHAIFSITLTPLPFVWVFTEIAHSAVKEEKMPEKRFQSFIIENLPN